MPRAQKGQRFGGRQVGAINKKTAAEISRQAIEEAAMEGQRPGGVVKKLGKDVLHDLMTTSLGLAAQFQRKIVNERGELLDDLKDQDLERFWKAMELAGLYAKALSPFQSYTFRAIAVPVSPGDGLNAPGAALPSPGAAHSAGVPSSKRLPAPSDAQTLDPAYQMRAYKAMLRGR